MRGMLRLVLPVAMLVSLGALVVSPAALADSTWTGATATSGNASASDWSNGSNWAAGVAPTPASAGTLTFPVLSSCDSSVDTCYESNNDLTGVNASGITIGDTTSYNFTGSAITLGAGGISAISSGTGLSATFGIPIALGADQTWSLIGGEDLSFSGNITASYTLGIGVSGGSIASLSGVEVGALTLSGTSSNSVFELSGPSYNGTDGSPVSLEGRALAEANFTTGPLTLTSGTLDLGTSSPETVTVNGALSTDSDSKIVPVVGTSGSSLLSAGGNVSLAGDLGLQGAGFTCLTLTPGQSYTLIQTTGGALSGTFANAPEGAVLPVPCAPTPDGYLRIHYTSTAVTATVIAVPSLSASGPASGTAETLIDPSVISASLSGGVSPSGTITFKVFGPQSSAPTDCSTGGTTVSTAIVSGNGTYNPSDGFTPSQAGDYWWYASYGGDSSNSAARSECGRSMPETVVGPAAVRLSKLRVSPQTFEREGRMVNGHCVAPTSRNSKKRRCQRPIKLAVSYQLSRPAQVRMTFEHLLPGRRVNGVCESPTAQNSQQPACFTAVAVQGALTKSGSQGTNSFLFDGHIGEQTLAPGCYRLTATPKANGQAGIPQTTAFRIAAPPWPCQNSKLSAKSTA